MLANPSNFIFLLPTDEFLVSLICGSAERSNREIGLQFCQQVHKKEEISSAAAFSRKGSRSQSARLTKPDQIHCHLTSFSVEELNVHHSATGILHRAVGTLNAIACYVAIDVNDFCHAEAKDKLLLIMQVGGCMKCLLVYIFFCILWI